MSLLLSTGFTEPQIQVIKSLIHEKISDSELYLFLNQCQRSGLDPFSKQIYAIPRGGRLTIMTGIDGFRLIAERSGKYAPGRQSTFEYDEKGNLISATSFVKKMTPDGTWHEVAATSFLSEFNASSAIWKKMPRVMLEKCSECRALRRAFPSDLSGLYSREEMDQAIEEAVDVKPEYISEDEIQMLEEALVGHEEFKKTMLGAFKEFKLIPKEKLPAILKRIAALKPEPVVEIKEEPKEEEFLF